MTGASDPSTGPGGERNARIVEGVRSWILKEGYPLEMRTAMAFEAAHWIASQAPTYSREGTFHEADLVATWMEPLGHREMFEVNVVVECKSSLDRPWVLFIAPTEFDLRIPLAFSTTAVGQRAYAVALYGAKLMDSRLFGQRGVIGYKLVPTSKSAGDRDDIAWKAICQVARGVKEEERLAHRTEGFHLFIPMIVLQGHLFSATLDKSGELKVEEIETGAVVTATPVDGRRQVVHIVTEAALPGFLREVESDLRTALSALRAAAPAEEVE